MQYIPLSRSAADSTSTLLFALLLKLAIGVSRE